MFKKSLTLILVLLMVSPIFTMSHEIAFTTTQTTPQESAAIVAETDFARVTLESNLFPNNGLEEWTNPHSPTGLQTSRTLEKDAWWEHSVVYEGSSAFGLEARAMDEYHFSEIYLNNQSQVYWSNPTNLTLDFQWYLDSIGNPVNQDYFRIQIRMDGRTMYYYMGCENTASANTTSSSYIMIAGATKTWNQFQRNLTSDYYESFGLLPIQYRTMYWYVRSYTTTYTRAYIDYIFMTNGTTTKISDSVSGGDFEGGGGWIARSGYGAGDIAQCADSHEGSYSMNLTALTFDDNAYAYASYQPRKLLSIDNQGNLSFWWNLDNYTNSNTATYARVVVSVENATGWVSNMYYYLFVGGSGMLPLILFGNDFKFAVDNFNVTDTWNFFDRNIWEDFTAVYSTENLWVDEIEFQVRNWADDTRLSLLVDDVTFTQSILSDMDYEQQNAVGDRIQGWSSPPGYSELTVTDFAVSGTKAMNLTLENDNQCWEGQKIGNLPIDSTTELILDFNVYIETFNASSEDFVLFLLNFNEESFAYVIANATSEFEYVIGEGDVPFILLQETFTTGEWLNFKLDIVHDYELLFGSLPDDNLSSIDLGAESIQGSKLTVLFDDLYIYYDISPEIISTDQSPAAVDEAGEIVGIIAEVIDASEVTVTVSYRVDAGAWTNITMDETTDGNYTIDINAPWGVTEYFITAEDAFGKTDVAMDGGDYFSFTTTDTTDPVILLNPTNGSTVSDIVAIEISVTEQGSGIAGVELFIEGASITNVTLDSIGISWDTNVITNGEYNITVVAEDNAGNTASVTHLVTVENVDAPADLSGVILIVVIIALGAIAVIYVFVVKKK